jgi:F0F1-type ATP synthase membrane subunit c/vacuolar-type H+-ATPase subunit K
VMDSSLRRLQTIRFALLGSIALYFLVSLYSPVASNGSPQLLGVLALTSAVIAVAVFVLRGKVLRPSASLAAAQPEDAAAISLWRTSHIIIWALCEVIPMYGLLLRYLGSSVIQAAPFFAAGFLLILFFGPRRPETVETT